MSLLELVRTQNWFQSMFRLFRFHFALNFSLETRMFKRRIPKYRAALALIMFTTVSICRVARITIVVGSQAIE